MSVRIKKEKVDIKKESKTTDISIIEKPSDVEQNESNSSQRTLTRFTGRDMSVLEWLEYQFEQGNSFADIYKDHLRAVFKRQVLPFKKKFSPESSGSSRRAKAVVQQFHQIFEKTIENLTQLDTAMLKEFTDTFPDVESDIGIDGCSTVSSSLNEELVDDESVRPALPLSGPAARDEVPLSTPSTKDLVDDEIEVVGPTLSLSGPATRGKVKPSTRSTKDVIDDDDEMEIARPTLAVPLSGPSARSKRPQSPKEKDLVDDEIEIVRPTLSPSGPAVKSKVTPSTPSTKEKDLVDDEIVRPTLPLSGSSAEGKVTPSTKDLDLTINGLITIPVDESIAESTKEDEDELTQNGVDGCITVSSSLNEELEITAVEEEIAEITIDPDKTVVEDSGCSGEEEEVETLEPVINLVSGGSASEGEVTNTNKSPVESDSKDGYATDRTTALSGRKPKLVSESNKEDNLAKKGLLDSSSDDDHSSSATPLKRTKKKHRKRSSKTQVILDWKTDPKCNLKAVVKLARIAPEIEKELKLNHYIMLNRDEEMETGEDSDSSDRKLDRAIKAISRFDPFANANDGACRTKKRSISKTKRTSNGKVQTEYEDGLHSEDEASEGPSSVGDILIGSKAIFDSGNSDAAEDLSDNCSKENLDAKKKEPEGQNRSDKAGNAARKTYITPAGILSDDSDDEARRQLLGKDSDDEDSDVASRKSKSAKTVKKEKEDKDRVGADADSEDSDEVIKKRPIRKRKAKTVLSDSDASIHSDIISLSSDDNDDDSDFKDSKSSKKEKKGRSKRSRSSSSDDTKNKKKKKKRKRIKNEKDSDDESSGSKVNSDDSDIQEIEAVPASQRRKKIRGIMKDKELHKSTREAEKEEEERKKRVLENQKLFNGPDLAAKLAEGISVDRLVLDIDPTTKKPLIEVDESIVSKLKPHQVEGIKFLYTTCFESVKMIQEGKSGGCILAHCMGLGKTLQTVAFTHTILSHQELTKVKSALVVCPLNTVTNWYKEYQMWLSDVDQKISVHSLWEGKNVNQRVDALKYWQRKGGIGIMHYDMFRSLVNSAVGKGKGKVKMSNKNREAIATALVDPGPDMVICDEGHLLKNYKSKLSEALSQIKTKRRIVLTGTPLQNNLIEYHTMVNFVKPNLLGSLKEFQNRFVNPIKNGQCKDSGDRDVKIMKRRAHVLHSKLNGCVQRLDYSVLVPYLPPKHEYCIVIKLSEKQKELYRHYLNTEVSEDQTDRARHLLQHYAMLIKILAHPIVLTMKKVTAETDEEDEEGSLKDFIDDGEESAEETPSSSDVECLESAKKPVPKRKTRSCKDPIDPIDANSNESWKNKFLPTSWWSSIFEKREDLDDVNLSGKLVILQEILKTCETIGDRVLVFSQYLTTLDIIEKFLAEWDEEGKKNSNKPITFPLNISDSGSRWRPGIEYFRIDGSTKTTDRQRHCDTFNSKTGSRPKLFLISTKAGGLGINLFGANRVVIFDASWNPSNDMQSIFRVYRFGQSKPCYIYRFVAQATMEEKIYNRQVVKLSLSSRVIDEHQVERHFKFEDITAMYKFEPDEKTERPVPPLPKDRLLADLLISHKNWIESYFEHDTLLINKEDEELTEEERKQAWDEYQAENERRVNPPQISAADALTLQKIRAKLAERHPGANPQVVEVMATRILQKINELRRLLNILNIPQPGMIPQEKMRIEQEVKYLQDLIAYQLNGPGGNIENQPPQTPPQQFVNQSRRGVPSHQRFNAASLGGEPMVSQLQQMMMNSVNRANVHHMSGMPGPNVNLPASSLGGYNRALPNTSLFRNLMQGTSGSVTEPLTLD